MCWADRLHEEGDSRAEALDMCFFDHYYACFCIDKLLPMTRLGRPGSHERMDAYVQAYAEDVAREWYANGQERNYEVR